MRELETPPDALAPEYILGEGADVWNGWRKTAFLVKHLTRRHLAQRYRGSSLGFLWTFFNPILMTCIYSFVFMVFGSRVKDATGSEIPFIAFFLTGYLSWNFFFVASLNAASSISDGGPLISKCYFPRIALPLSAIFSNLMNFLISLPILLALCVLLGQRPGIQFLWLPVGLLLLLLLAVGVGIIISCFAAFFRDLLQVIEVLFMAWFFATPIFVPFEFIQDAFTKRDFPEFFLTLYKLNPMVGAVRFMHAIFLNLPLPWTDIAISTTIGFALLAFGIWYFKRMSARFANVT